MITGKILVVDDEPDIRALIKEILEDEGFSVAAELNRSLERKNSQLQKALLLLLAPSNLKLTLTKKNL